MKMKMTMMKTMKMKMTVSERLGTTRSQLGVTMGTASSTSSPPTEFSTLITFANRKNKLSKIEPLLASFCLMTLPSMTGTPSTSLIPETSETAALLYLLPKSFLDNFD